MIVAIITITFIIILYKKIKQRVVKKTLESSRIFYPFNDYIHESTEQQDRLKRSVLHSIKLKKILINGYSGKIIGASGNEYYVTLRSCTCPDFKRRKLPCKHMYFLAVHTRRCTITKGNGSYIIKNISQNYDVSLLEPNPTKVIQKSTKSSEHKKASLNANPEFMDNMNYMMFDGEGLFLKTGRKRKFRIEAFSVDEARSKLIASGFDPSTINVVRSQFEPPTKEQIEAMHRHGNIIPRNACKIDVSFIMSKIIEEQRNPERELIEFATKHKVMFSYFTGEKSLYSCIWNTFNDTEKAAFYLLCVKKETTGKWEFDAWESYMRKASAILNDSKFINSFKRYLNSGFYGFNNETSKNTNCYKIAALL